MGVNGLLNLLKLIQDSIHVRNFSHKAAGIGANYLGHRSRYFGVEYRISKILCMKAYTALEGSVI